MRQFDGKVALVTGASLGLGKATAEAFAREGAKVVLAARREDRGREVEAAIRAAGGEATFIQCDVRQEAQVQALVERTVALYGRLDCAYNNAGPKAITGPFAELTTDSLDAMLAGFLRSIFFCMKYEIKAMLASGGGAIVNCSSVASVATFAYMSIYAAAKAGADALTRTAALEYAQQNIRINTVCTGSFDTPMSREVAADLPKEVVQAMVSRIALQRMGNPEELAHAVLFLCSPGASFVTGTNLVVDGGRLLT